MEGLITSSQDIWRILEDYKRQLFDIYNITPTSHIQLQSKIFSICEFSVVFHGGCTAWSGQVGVVDVSPVSSFRIKSGPYDCCQFQISVAEQVTPRCRKA